MGTTGQKIKKRRLELGMTVEDLAKRLNKSISTVYRYESEEIRTFSLDVLQDLAFALNTTPAELLGVGRPGTIPNIPENKTLELSAEEQLLINKFRLLNFSAKIKLNNYLDDLIANNANHKNPNNFKKWISSCQIFNPNDQ